MESPKATADAPWHHHTRACTPSTSATSQCPPASLSSRCLPWQSPKESLPSSGTPSTSSHPSRSEAEVPRGTPCSGLLGNARKCLQLVLKTFWGSMKERGTWVPFRLWRPSCLFWQEAEGPDTAHPQESPRAHMAGHSGCPRCGPHEPPHDRPALAAVRAHFIPSNGLMAGHFLIRFWRESSTRSW